MLKVHQWTYVAAFFCLFGWVCSGPASGADTADTPAAAPVKMTRFDTVQLNVQNTDLLNVLQLLSVQGRKNIVPSPAVKGTVTANLYDVTFHEALDAICQQNGCGYIEKGNFIYIYTVDELKKIQQAQRTVSHRIFTLNYLTAKDASTYVTPLLSSAGSIAMSGTVGAGFQPTVSDGGADSSAQQSTLLVRDYPENLDEIAKALKQLDTQPYQVLVEATILQADVSDEAAFGVDFALLGDVAVDAFTNPLSGISDLFTDTNPLTTDKAQILTSTVGNVPGGRGGLKAGIVTNNVAAFIRALDSVTDTTILANPKLMVLNRQRADVLIGKKVGYLSTTATATATTQTVEFLDTGTQLTLRPFVAKQDGRFVIRLELKPQVSEAQIRNVVPGTNTVAVTVPDEVTQELTTNVMVHDGQTVVLGGLFKEKTEISREQVPGLGDVPIVGNAFKGRDDTVERTEVIFLITPHVVKDKALYAAGDSAKDAIEMKRLGARNGLLPWCRSKMTAGHLRDALKYLKENNRDRALWEVDMALSLEPARIEAIRLKEKLTGQRVYGPNNSILQQAVDLMIEKQTGMRKQQRRARPMTPSPRPSEPVSDAEPLTTAPAKTDATVSDPTTDTADATTDLAAPAIESTAPTTDTTETVEASTDHAGQATPIPPATAEATSGATSITPTETGRNPDDSQAAAPAPQARAESEPAPSPAAEPIPVTAPADADTDTTDTQASADADTVTTDTQASADADTVATDTQASADADTDTTDTQASADADTVTTDTQASADADTVTTDTQASADAAATDEYIDGSADEEPPMQSGDVDDSTAVEADSPDTTGY